MNGSLRVYRSWKRFRIDEAAVGHSELHCWPTIGERVITEESGSGLAALSAIELNSSSLCFGGLIWLGRDGIRN